LSYYLLKRKSLIKI